MIEIVAVLFMLMVLHGTYVSWQIGYLNRSNRECRSTLSDVVIKHNKLVKKIDELTDSMNNVHDVIDVLRKNGPTA